MLKSIQSELAQKSLNQTVETTAAELDVVPVVANRPLRASITSLSSGCASAHRLDLNIPRMPTPPPKVFLSYSHDSETHKDWVLKLATRLIANGVDVLLDQ